MTELRPRRSAWKTLRWLAVGVLMVGGLVLFGMLIHLSGPAEVFAVVKGMGVTGFVVVTLSVLLSMLTWALSWYALLRGAGITALWHHSIPPLLAGYAVTYLTPSMYVGGEPVRAYWVARDAEVPTARVMGTIVIERILSGLSVLAFASIGGVLTLASPTVSVADKGAIGLALGGLTFVLVAAVVLLARNVRLLSRLLTWLARRVPSRGRLARAAAHVTQMEDETHRAFTHYRGYTLLAFALQLLTVFLHYIRPQIFFHFTQRTLFTFPQLSLYFTLALFVNAFLWITPGGFGITDGGRVAVFTLLGVPASGAVAFNLVFRFVDLVFVGIGVQFLLRRGLLSLHRGRVTMPSKSIPDPSPSSSDRAPKP